jgi:hypothetical protein
VSPPLEELSEVESEENFETKTEPPPAPAAPFLQDLNLTDTAAAATAADDPHNSVTRQEEIIRGYLRATHIKASLLELLGSSSRSSPPPSLPPVC